MSRPSNGASQAQVAAGAVGGGAGAADVPPGGLQMLVAELFGDGQLSGAVLGAWVAWPLRSECAASTAGSSPAARARRLRISATAAPDSR